MEARRSCIEVVGIVMTALSPAGGDTLTDGNEVAVDVELAIAAEASNAVSRYAGTPSIDSAASFRMTSSSCATGSSKARDPSLSTSSLEVSSALKIRRNGAQPP